MVEKRVAVPVVTNGVARAVVVIPKEPSAVVRYAADELKFHIAKATGAELMVRSEAEITDLPEGARIYLGPCEATGKAGLSAGSLVPNGFISRVDGDSLYLIGRDDQVSPPLSDDGSMGTLFAVYDWVESQLHAKWLWPGETGTVVPPATEVFLGGQGEKKVEPRLIHSRMRLSAWPGGMGPERRKQYILDTSVWLRRQRFARGVSLDYGHAYTQYWERFGETHPEYFALRPDGVRAPFDPKRPQLVQMCVSNPGLWGQIIADWQVQRKQKPRLPWINGAENDKTANDPACSCEVCRSWDAKGPSLEGQNPFLAGAEAGGTDKLSGNSYSDRYAKFWLALQREAMKLDPGATVLGYAYADYAAPPRETKLNQNIIVGIVPPYSFPTNAEESKRFRAMWQGWSAAGARLYLRPNYTLVGYAMPYIYARQAGEEFKFAAEHGMVATDFDSLLGMWGVQGPNAYVLARLHIDPSRKVDDVLDEYYAGFGPAAGPIRKYFSYWEGVTSKADPEFRRRVQGGWGVISKGGDEVYTAETFQTGGSLLEAAERAAQRDPAASARVEFLAVWLEHARLSAQVLTCFHAQQKSPKDAGLRQAFESDKGRLDEYRRRHEDVIGNVGILRQLEVWSGWRKAKELAE